MKENQITYLILSYNNTIIYKNLFISNIHPNFQISSLKFSILVAFTTIMTYPLNFLIIKVLFDSIIL